MSTIITVRMDEEDLERISEIQSNERISDRSTAIRHIILKYSQIVKGQEAHV